MNCFHLRLRSWLSVASMLLALGCADGGGPCGAARDAGATSDAAPPPPPPPPSGYVVHGGWAVRGQPATVESCAAEGIVRVRLRILDRDATVIDEDDAPCERGELQSARAYAWGPRYYGEWQALAANGSVREAIPVTRPITIVQPRDTVELPPIDFQPRPIDWLDYRAVGSIYFSGWTSSATCTDQGIDSFRLALTPAGGGAEVTESVRCADAFDLQNSGQYEVRTGASLTWGVLYDVVWTARAADGTELRRVSLGQVRMASPTRALAGLSVLVTTTTLDPFN